MVTVILAALGEGRIVGAVAAGVEHHGLLAVAGNAVTLQIREVCGERRRTEGAALVAGDARLHHDAAGRTEQPVAAEADPAAPE